MLTLKRHVIAGLTVAGIALSAMTAHAQVPEHGPEGGKPSAEQIAKFEQHRVKRQAELHDKLKITAAQESAWQAFIAKSTPTFAPGDKPVRLSKDEWQKLSAPARIEHRLEGMKRAEAHLSAQLDATKTFYATLTPEQQKIFDQDVAQMEKHEFREGHRFGHQEGKHGAPEASPGVK